MSYGFLYGQIDKQTHRYKNGDRSWHRHDQFLDEEGHSLDLTSAEAIRIIRAKYYNGKKLALRRGRWKLHTDTAGSVERYDMDDDRSETVNLANDNANVVSELLQLVAAQAALDQNE